MRVPAKNAPMLPIFSGPSFTAKFWIVTMLLLARRPLSNRAKTWYR